MQTLQQNRPRTRAAARTAPRAFTHEEHSKSDGSTESRGACYLQNGGPDEALSENASRGLHPGIKR